MFSFHFCIGFSDIFQLKNCDQDEFVKCDLYSSNFMRTKITSLKNKMICVCTLWQVFNVEFHQRTFMVCILPPHSHPSPHDPIQKISPGLYPPIPESTDLPWDWRRWEWQGWWQQWQLWQRWWRKRGRASIADPYALFINQMAI